MPTIAELKAKTLAAIEARSDWLIDVAKTILDHPEAGFQEVKTARFVSKKLHELGIAHDTAPTGMKAIFAVANPAHRGGDW
jgi:metal-dependent amidase/aminoacylase/carboxypeptidase family protein